MVNGATSGRALIGDDDLPFVIAGGTYRPTEQDYARQRQRLDDIRARMNADPYRGTKRKVRAAMQSFVKTGILDFSSRGEK